MMTLHYSLRWILDFGWLFFLLFLLRHFWQTRRDLLRARLWLKTKGHITQCEWVNLGHTLWPKINYSYCVHERDLMGDQVFLETAYRNPYSKSARLMAYKVALAYKEGTEIDVYYDPNQPDLSALDISIPKKLNFILILIGVLIVLHLAIIGMHWVH